MKVLAKNKKATFDFSIEKKYEAGILLKGWEVKTIKNNNISLEGSFIFENKEEIFLRGVKIKPWRYTTNISEVAIAKDRKLLLNKSEILSLKQRVKEQSFTIIPIEFYVDNKNRIKLTIGLAKGKKKFDKRAQIKEKDIKKSLKEDFKNLRLH